MTTLTQLLDLSPDHDGILPYIWIGDDSQSVCINPNSAEVFAILRHDGFRKYYPTLYVCIPIALRLRSQQAACGFRLCSFTRCTVELFRLKCRSMAQAQESIDELFIDLRIV